MKCKNCDEEVEHKDEHYSEATTPYDHEGYACFDKKLSNLLDAIHDLEGVPIPFNIILHNIQPLQAFLEDLRDNGIRPPTEEEMEAVRQAQKEAKEKST